MNLKRSNADELYCYVNQRFSDYFICMYVFQFVYEKLAGNIKK